MGVYQSQRLIRLLRPDEPVGSTSAGGDFIERGRATGVEDDQVAVGAPGALAEGTRAGLFADPDGHPALNRDLLELPTSAEPDEITVWRPERPPSSFGAFNGPRFLLIEVLNPQLSLRSPRRSGRCAFRRVRWRAGC